MSVFIGLFLVPMSSDIVGQRKLRKNDLILS